MTNHTESDQPKCASDGVDPALFYSYDPKLTSEAKEICAECPLRFACLESALNFQEKWGTWGGANQNELRIAQSIDSNGDPKNYGTGFPTRCLYCGPRSTKYLSVVEKKRSGTRVACSNCGLEWVTKKIINKAQNNF